jgi:hypothetical protein
MDMTNIIMIFVGIIVIVIGIVGFINPNFTRLINAPGSPRLKAIIAIVIGIVILFIGLIIQIPS